MCELFYQNCARTNRSMSKVLPLHFMLTGSTAPERPSRNAFALVLAQGLWGVKFDKKTRIYSEEIQQKGR